MATNYPTELKYMLECGICLNRFEDPRVLPCLHSYCLGCLKSHITSNREPDGAFTCPQCRERCILHQDGAEHFPKNFFVNAMKEIIPKLESKPKKDQNQKCDIHHDLKISWYCKTCSLPACPCCIIENHKSHVTENLSMVEAAFKTDLFDVSNLASKRIDFLQTACEDIESQRMKMENELNQTSQRISETGDSICRLIRQHEATLQDKLQRARHFAREHFVRAIEQIETAKENTSSLKLCAETLLQTSHEEALCTVIQAPVNKEQFLQQQEIPLPSVQWHFDRNTTEPGQRLSSASFMGSIGVNTSAGTKQESQTENTIIKTLVNTTELAYKGSYAISSITPIYKSMVCVAHFNEQYIWVYGDERSGFIRKIWIPDIDQITGMIAIDRKEGKLAIVDNKHHTVHLVIISKDIIQTSTDRESPWCAVQTSWGHVLVADHLDEIKVFSEGGEFLGKVHDNNGSITNPDYIYIDETERLIYVGSGGEVGKQEVRAYTFAPSDFQ